MNERPIHIRSTSGNRLPQSSALSRARVHNRNFLFAPLKSDLHACEVCEREPQLPQTYRRLPGLSGRRHYRSRCLIYPHGPCKRLRRVQPSSSKYRAQLADAVRAGRGRRQPRRDDAQHLARRVPRRLAGLRGRARRRNRRGALPASPPQADEQLVEVRPRVAGGIIVVYSGV